MSKLKKVIADYKLLLENVPALVTTIFVLCTCIMNIMAGKVIFNVGNVAMTGGFLLSAVPFLCMDTVCKRFNARASIMLNILSALANVFVVVMLAIVAAIPTKDDYSEFNYVAGGIWFIALSSTVAFIVSGVANSIINTTIGKLFKNGTSVIEFMSRSYISTFIGQAIDNFLFIWLTYGIFSPIFWKTEPLPILTCCGTAVVGGFIELFAEVALSPIAFRIVQRWERNSIGQAYVDAHKDDKF